MINNIINMQLISISINPNDVDCKSGPRLPFLPSYDPATQGWKVRTSECYIRLQRMGWWNAKGMYQWMDVTYVTY